MVTYRDVTGLSVSLRGDHDVAQVEDGGDDFENAALTAVLDTWRHTQLLEGADSAPSDPFSGGLGPRRFVSVSPHPAARRPPWSF